MQKIRKRVVKRERGGKMIKWTYYAWIILGLFLAFLHSMNDADIRLISDWIIIMGSCICLEIENARN